MAGSNRTHEILQNSTEFLTPQRMQNEIACPLIFTISALDRSEDVTISTKIRGERGLFHFTSFENKEEKPFYLRRVEMQHLGGNVSHTILKIEN